MPEVEFPNGPALKGKVYVMDTPYGQRVIIMSEESWGDFGTLQESMRQLLKKQDDRIKELLAENAQAKLNAADALTRLENIREARRNDMRKRIDVDDVAELIMPGDRKFSTNQQRRK